MVIDLILDRQYEIVELGEDYYEPRKFYHACIGYNEVFEMDTIENIIKAMDYGTEDDVKNAICDYIIRAEYSTDICDFVRSVNWI